MKGSRFFFQLVFICATGTTSTFAHAEYEWFFSPAIGAGTNSAQQTYVSLGADLGVFIDENFSAGVGAYYSFGARPEHDREIGAGPFVGYHYPLLKFLSFNARQSILYVDQRNPVELSNGSYTHTDEKGVASATYAGVHLNVGDHLGVSVGYRLVVGLSNSALDDGRSGLAFGIGIGF